MAVSPPTNEAFLREVDEELRRDAALKLWQRFGRLAIAVVVGALALFAAYLGWQAWQQQRAGAQSEQFDAIFETLRKNSGSGADKQLSELAAQGNPGYRANALFVQADVALQKNDLAKAAMFFGQLAADTNLPQPMRDLALIRQTSAEFDRIKPEQIVARLKPLAVKGNPWLGSAGELLAAAYLQLGRTQEAGRLFRMIAEEQTVPQSLRTRTVQMAGALGQDAINQNDTAESKAQ